jgi:hypothetical protein
MPSKANILGKPKQWKTVRQTGGRKVPPLILWLLKPAPPKTTTGHPIHPMLVYFPVAFFIFAFVLDVVYEAGGGGRDLTQFAYILLIAGFATGLAAAIPGLVEYGIIVDE